MTKSVCEESIWPWIKEYARAQGAHVWDASGRRYIDFTCSWGSTILGHGHPAVLSAVSEQLERGVLLPGRSDLHNKLLSRLVHLYPSAETGFFLKTGSEATAAAVRLARAATGKDVVLRCGYHGWHDWCHQGVGTTHHDAVLLHRPSLAGVPAQVRSLTIDIGPHSDFSKAHDLIEQWSDRAACLIIDPTVVRNPPGAVLQQIAAWVRDAGILFVLDEVKTGFRVAIGGAQSLYNLNPDITILGKALSNGFPLSVVLVRQNLIETERAFTSGTYDEETLSLAAALATLTELEGKGVIPRLWELGERFLKKVNRAIQEAELCNQIVAEPWNEPPMPFFWFKSATDARGANARAAFYSLLLERGILMYGDHMNFLSAAHSDEDVEEAVFHCTAALKVFREHLV